MEIITVSADDRERIEQMAQLLVDGFRHLSPQAWPTVARGRQSVEKALKRGFVRAAVDEAGVVIGWIGGAPEYQGHVWELHPLVVNPAHHRQGIGRALVLDLEDQVRARGGGTIMLGTDDEAGLTTLSGVDLYDDLPAKIAQAKGTSPHPLEFYRRLGYVIIGVVPDANGYGKPDILMGKRVSVEN